MAFSANPLALSVSETAFESWLRDTGYLEILDSRSSSSSTATTAAAADHPPPPTNNNKITTTATATSLFSLLRTLISLLTLNPFARLTPGDFSGPTAPWTASFLAGPPAYSFPAGPAQARMRAQENVKRYARNYAFLSLIIFACALYRMPVSLIGAASSLALWEMVRYGGSRWEMEERHPVLRQLLLRLVQIVTAVILYLCNLQVTLMCAVGVSYTVMIMHASLRKLAPSKQTTGTGWHKRNQQKR